MEIYKRAASHWLCGHWNDSPVEIGLTGVMKSVPHGEVYHFHDYHEYYVILNGKGTLNVEGGDVPLEAETVVMVRPGERHRVTWIDPEAGIQWVVIKEKSVPNSKRIAAE